MDKPLAGIRVLESGTAWAAPYAADVLALLGADVVKVESRQRLDLMRMHDPDVNKGLAFNDVNLNKRSILIGMRHERGREIMHRLVAKADVFIENWRPGVMDRLGLGYQTLREINPRIIMTSVSGFGSTGPESGYGGYAAVFAGLGGLAELTGYPDWEPGLIRSPMDLTSANSNAAMIVAALMNREFTGEGCFLDVAVVEQAATLIPLALSAVQIEGDSPYLHRRGNEGVDAFQGCYRCRGADNWVALAVPDGMTAERFGQMLRHEVGDAAAPIVPFCTDPHTLLAHQREVDAVIEGWTLNQDAWSVAALFQGWGIPAHPTSSPPYEAGEEHLRARAAIGAVEHPVQGIRAVFMPPWRQTGQVERLGRPEIQHAPLFGDHTRAVLAEWIGVTEAEYEELEHSGLFC